MSNIQPQGLAIAAAADLKLSANDLRRLSEVFPSGAAAGLRYPENMMSRVNA